MRDTGQKDFWIDRASRTFEHASNGDHTNHTPHPRETVFDKPPLMVPSNQPRLNFEALKCFEIMAKLGDRITDHGKRFVLSCNRKNARA